MKRYTSRRVLVVMLASVVLLSGAASAANYTVSSGVGYTTDSGLTVTAGEQHSVSGDPFKGAETVVVNNVSFSAAATSNVTADNFVGSWTNLSAIDANTATITIDPKGKSNISVSGDVQAVNFSDVALNDEQVDFVHTSTGAGSISVSGLPALTTFTAATASGSSLGQYTTNSDGNATISVSSATDQRVLLFQPEAPSADNASASPQGGEKQSLRDVELSVPISDADFPTSQGDTVTVDIYLNGNQIDSRTISSNQTISNNVTVSQGGDQTWHVELTDSYGETASSETFNFQVPADLKIRKERNPSELIDNAKATITFYQGSTSATTITRNTSDGALNLTGVPLNQEFVIETTVDGYVNRRIFIESVFRQQRIYLLNNSAQQTETIFEIADYSGTFPQDETVLQVQRSFNGSWQTVAGDFFGATGQFPTVLNTRARYRLVLVNPSTGARRELGTYQPLTAQTERIEVAPSGVINFEQQDISASISPGASLLPAVNQSLTVELRNASNRVDSMRVVATVDETGKDILNTTTTQTSLQETLPVSGLAGQHVTVTVTATADGSTTKVGEQHYSIAAAPGNDMSLLSTLADLTGLAAPGTAAAFQMFLAMVVTIMGMAGVVTRMPVGGETAGLTGVLILSGFSVIGWVPYSLVFVGGVGVVSVAGLRRGL